VREEIHKATAKPAGLPDRVETLESSPLVPTMCPAKRDTTDLQPETPESNNNNGTQDRKDDDNELWTTLERIG